MDKNLIDLPVGQVFIVTALEGSEQTLGAATIHAVTVIWYGKPGESCETEHSSASLLQLV